MANTYKGVITRNTDWGGDSSTSGLPVAGQSIQKFVKDELNSKIGAIYKSQGGNQVYCFANEEDKAAYIESGDTSKLITSFETVSNYSVKINLEETPLTYSLLSGATGSTIKYCFKITDTEGLTSDSKATVIFTFLCNGITKSFTTQVTLASQGWTTVTSDLIDDYLGGGTNTITIAITGESTKATTQFNVSYNIFDLAFNPSFEYNIVQEGNTISLPFTIKCSETKYMEYYIDGESVSSSESMVISDVYRDTAATIDISSLSVGAHSLQVRAYVKAGDGTLFYTPSHYYQFAKFGFGNTSFLMHMLLDNTQAIASAESGLTIETEQFSQIAFDWSLYDYNERKLQVHFDFDGDNISNDTIDKNGEEHTFSFRPMSYGNGKILHIYAYDDDEETAIFDKYITFDINESDSGIKEAEGYLLKLQSTGRRNSDENKDVWSCIGNDGNEYKATFSGFSWNSQQGWNADDEALIISNGATVQFNIQPMIKNWAKNGGTVEIDLETFDISNDDAVICECSDVLNNSKFKITATEASINTEEGVSISTRYKDNERLKIAFIGNKIGTHEDGNLLYIVVNGVLERAALYTDSDSIYSQGYLSIGDPNGECKVKLRSIRVYNKAITVDEAFNNYVIDSDDVQTIYEKNNVLGEGSTEISFDAVANKLPVMIFTGDMDQLVTEGQTSKTTGTWYPFDVEYINRQEPERNFVAFNAKMKLQGTSSLGYPRKNFKLKTKEKTWTKEYHDTYAKYTIDMSTVAGNRMLKNKTTGKNIDFDEISLLNGMCYTFDYEGNPLKKGKYKFRENAHKADKWTLKADFMESSGAHNVGAGRSWNDIFENVKLTTDGYVNNTYQSSAIVHDSSYKNGYSTYENSNGKYKINIDGSQLTAQDDYVCRTNAQKICIAEGQDDIRTAIDGFPMVCFYRTSHTENNLIFMGQYNFINDKSSFEVFGFEDIEDPNVDNQYIFDSDKVECWEGLKNANPISLFQTIKDFDDTEKGCLSTFESRYPDPDDYGVTGKKWYDASIGSPIYELCKWLVSTRHESAGTIYDLSGNVKTTGSDTININADFAKRINSYQYGYSESNKESYAYAEGTNVPDTAENRQKKFETEKWEHFDVWKLAGYYIYLRRYGAVDQFVKNTMLFTDGNGKYDSRTDNAYRKWFYINYDNDCLFGLRNNGQLAFDWKLDRQTLDGAGGIIKDEAADDEGNVNTYAMMGHDSTLWNNLEADEEFMRMVRDLDNSMYSVGLNYDNMVKEFDTDQTEKWCERIYNANERYKYIYPAKGIGDTSGTTYAGVNNLWMLQGTRRSHRHWWIANHFNLLDAQWLSGDYKKTYVEMKVDSQSGSTIHAKAGADYYYAWGQQKKIYESNIQKKEGETIDFTFDTNQVQGDPVYIYAINKMSEMDFSDEGIMTKVTNGSFEFHVGNTDVQNTLTKLVIGNKNCYNNASGIVTSSWAVLNNLEYLDITNYGGIQTIPFSSFKNLHTFLAEGTTLGSFIPSEGSQFSVVKLPSTIQTLTLNDISFSNFTTGFSYTPTKLRNLTLSNNDGIGVVYYTNLIKPWIEKIEASSMAAEIYANSKIDISDINWEFSSLENIRIFKNFKKYASEDNFKLRGQINLTPVGNLSKDNIAEIKSIFGENCFNKKFASLYVITPDSVFINAKDDVTSIVAGQSIEFERELYPDEASVTSKNYSITYSLVQEVEAGTDDAIYDVLTDKYYLPVSNVESIRQGITFTNTKNSEGKEIGLLKTNELVLGVDTDITVLVQLEVEGSTYIKVSSMQFTIKDPTYAVSASVTGTKSLYLNNQYDFDLTLLTNKNVSPIGSYTVDWSIEGTGLQYLESYGKKDGNKLVLNVKTTNTEPEISDSITIYANIKNYDGTSCSASFYTLVLNQNDIMSIESNPVAMTICYNEGWAENQLAMTKSEAEAVTDIGMAFASETEEYAFNEFVYFTGLKSLPASAFSNSNITDIALPQTIETIGAGCFANCTNLTNIYDSNTSAKTRTMPSVTIIPEGCFLNCRNLGQLILPDSVTEIDNFAFGGTKFISALIGEENLAENTLILSNNITLIQKNAFESSECNIANNQTDNKLQVLALPDNINLVKNYEVLYGRCYKQFIVSENNTRYSVDSYGCLYDFNKETLLRFLPNRDTYLSSYEMPNSVLMVYPYSFTNVYNLGEVIGSISINLNGLNEHIFDYSNITRIDFSLSNNLQKIPDYGFVNCSKLTEILLPNTGNLVELGRYAFAYCPLLESLDLPDSINTFVEDPKSGTCYTFVNLGSIKEIKLPSNLTYASYPIVKDCNSLIKFEFSKNFSNLGVSHLIDGATSLETIVLPLLSYTEKKYGLKDADGNIVAEYDTIDEANEHNTGSYTIEEIEGDSIVTKDKDGNNISIKYDTFYNCPMLKEFITQEDEDGKYISCEDSVLYCSGGTQLYLVPAHKGTFTIHSGVTSIADGAFYLNNAIDSITIPNSVLEIGNYTFYSVSATTIEMSKNVNSIGSRAFYNSCVTALTFESKITSISDYAFASSALKILIFKKGLIFISDDMCNSCIDLERLEIWDAFSSVGYFSLTYSPMLKNIVFLSKTAPQIFRGDDDGKWCGFGQGNRNLSDKRGWIRDYPGWLSKSDGNTMYLPYGYTGYDEAIWNNIVFDSEKCGYSIKYASLKGSVLLSIYNNGTLMTDDITLYLKSESGDLKYGDNIATASWNSSLGKYQFSTSENLYSGEILKIYKDEDCTEEIGEITAVYGTYEYTVGAPILSYSVKTKKLFESGVFGAIASESAETETVENETEDEFAEITVKEYKSLLAKINLLTDLINNI